MRRSLLLAPFAWAFPGGASAEAREARVRTELPPSLLDHGARLLADLIRQTRESAIASGVWPIPLPIQRRLFGFFPDAILRKVRYAGGQAEMIGIPGLAMTYGHIDAVTTADVVLFRDDKMARTDDKLWAHELTHVMQYERWGIDGFARRYLQDSEALEKEASDNADRYVSWSEHARL